jgi:hypothetical protein
MMELVMPTKIAAIATTIAVPKTSARLRINIAVTETCLTVATSAAAVKVEQHLDQLLVEEVMGKHAISTRTVAAPNAETERERAVAAWGRAFRKMWEHCQILVLSSTTLPYVHVYAHVYILHII